MEQETDGPVVGGGALSGKARIRERSFSLKIVSLTLGRERKARPQLPMIVSVLLNFTNYTLEE